MIQPREASPFSARSVPLFFVQIPQKTLSRLGLKSNAWEYALEYLTGIKLSESDVTTTFISTDEYKQILLAGKRLFGDDNYVNWYVNDIQAHHFGPIGLAIITAPTIGKSLDVWLEVAPALVPVSTLDKKISKNSVICRMNVFDEMNEIHEVFLNMSLFLLRKFLISVGAVDDDIQIRFSHSQTISDEFYRENFGCIPEFNAKHDEIIIANSVLNRTNEGSSPLTFKQALIDSRALVTRAKNLISIRQRVSHILLETSKRDVFFSLDDVADRLHLSSRTLSRRLQQEGVSFRDIQTEIRIDRAKQQLKDTSRPIKDICSKAGFSNLSAFSRAFRKYTQLSPSEYRAQFVSSK
jgi:AraC-like DNA-binding protein